MPKFTKRILKPGTYTIDRADGTKSRVYIGPRTMQKWVDNFQQMRKNGLNVPAPWRHDKRAVPRLDREESDVDTFNNAGFWEDFWVDEEGYFTGRVDVPLETDAEKVGKTVVECSPLLHPKWVDGLGNEYPNCVTHCALVTHPVVPDQENFEPAEDPAISLSLDGLVYSQEAAVALAHGGEDDLLSQMDNIGGREGFSEQISIPSQDVRAAIQQLRLAGIDLPDDVKAENFILMVTIAARAANAAREAAGSDGFPSITQRPPKSVEKTSPATVPLSLEGNVMSTDFEIALSLLNKHKKEDGSDYTLADLQALKPQEPEPIQLSKQQQAALDYAHQQGLNEYKERIVRCVKEGRISPALAKDKAGPLLETVQLSFDEQGNRLPTNLDVILETWESIPVGAFLTGKSPTTVKKSNDNLFGQQAFSLEGAVTHELDMETAPDEIPGEVSDNEADRIADMILQSSGIKTHEQLSQTLQ